MWVVVKSTESTEIHRNLQNNRSKTKKCIREVLENPLKSVFHWPTLMSEQSYRNPTEILAGIHRMCLVFIVVDIAKECDRA